MDRRSRVWICAIANATILSCPKRNRDTFHVHLRGIEGDSDPNPVLSRHGVEKHQASQNYEVRCHGCALPPSMRLLDIVNRSLHVDASICTLRKVRHGWCSSWRVKLHLLFLPEWDLAIASTHLPAQSASKLQTTEHTTCHHQASRDQTKMNRLEKPESRL